MDVYKNEAATIRVDLFDIDVRVQAEIEEEIWEILRSKLDHSQYDLVVFDS